MIDSCQEIKGWLIVLTQTNITGQETLKSMQQKWMEELS